MVDVFCCLSSAFNQPVLDCSAFLHHILLKHPIVLSVKVLDAHLNNRRCRNKSQEIEDGLPNPSQEAFVASAELEIFSTINQGRHLTITTVRDFFAFSADHIHHPPQCLIQAHIQ